jgi:predicted transglutaminase-like cysteine proteinase
MSAPGISRTIAVPIAVLVTLLAGSEMGLASSDLTSGRVPRMGSAQAFANAQSTKIDIAGTQTAALNAVEEPFASLDLHFSDGPLARIWQDVKVRVLTDMARLALCAAQEVSCSPAARAVRDIVSEARSRDGLARVGFINRAVNLAIKPTVDPFVWRSPLETLSVGAGDCKEYAVAKYFTLLEAGIPEPDLKLVIVRDMAARQDHAIVAVRINAAWFLLDNRWLALIRDIELSRAEPLYMLDEHGVRRFEPQQARSTPTAQSGRAAN